LYIRGVQRIAVICLGERYVNLLLFVSLASCVR